MNTQWREILPLCGAYSIATAVFNIAPLLIGALITVLGFMEEPAGLLMTLELVAISVVAFVLAPWGPRFSNRTAMLSSVILAFLAHALSANTDNYSALIALRVLAGISCGLLLLAVNTRVAAHEEPVRIYGLVMVATTVVGAILLATIPTLIQQFQMLGVYGALAALCVLFVALVATIPDPAADESSDVRSEHAPLPISIVRVVMLMGALFLVQFTQSGFYSFSERFGIEHVGLTTEEMGVVLAIGYLGSIPGAALASWVGYRYGRLSPLLMGLALFAVCVNLAVFTNNTMIFRFAFVAFNFFFFFSIPYQLGISADLDHTGRLAGAGIGVFFFGLACGPFLGGYLVGTHGYSSLAICVSVAVIIGMGVYAAITLRHDFRGAGDKA